MNETKTEQKGKTSFTEKISAHLSSGWCSSKCALVKTVYRSRVYCEWKWLYVTFPQQPMTELTDMLK